MLPESAIPALFVLSGVLVTSFVQTINTRYNQKSELRKERLRNEFELSNNQNTLVRDKLELAYGILSEISREFSITFLTIDRSLNITASDFHEKYRNLCSKASEVQMIADFYAPSVSTSVEELYGLMNHYWGHFHIVLTRQDQGEKIKHTDPSFLNAIDFAQKIPAQTYDIQRKISDIVHSHLYQ